MADSLTSYLMCTLVMENCRLPMMVSAMACRRPRPGAPPAEPSLPAFRCVCSHDISDESTDLRLRASRASSAVAWQSQ